VGGARCRHGVGYVHSTQRQLQKRLSRRCDRGARTRPPLGVPFLASPPPCVPAPGAAAAACPEADAGQRTLWPALHMPNPGLAPPPHCTNAQADHTIASPTTDLACQKTTPARSSAILPCMCRLPHHPVTVLQALIEKRPTHMLQGPHRVHRPRPLPPQLVARSRHNPPPVVASDEQLRRKIGQAGWGGGHVLLQKEIYCRRLAECCLATE